MTTETKRPKNWLALPLSDGTMFEGKLTSFRFDPALGVKLQLAGKTGPRAKDAEHLVIVRAGTAFELIPRGDIMPVEQGRFALWCDLKLCANPAAKNALTLEQVVEICNAPPPKEEVAPPAEVVKTAETPPIERPKPVAAPTPAQERATFEAEHAKQAAKN